jgi:preprotein translocase subunit SecD
VLYYLSNTSVVKGFALIFGIGVLVSMFTAITVSRTFLLAVATKGNGKVMRFLLNNGFRRAKVAKA